MAQTTECSTLVGVIEHSRSDYLLLAEGCLILVQRNSSLVYPQSPIHTFLILVPYPGKQIIPPVDFACHFGMWCLHSSHQFQEPMSDH